jgi:hypothetical protein
MLARYMRAASMDDVIVDAFARGRGKEQRRNVLRNLIRIGTGSLRVLLATIYLRGKLAICGTTTCRFNMRA